MSEDLEGGFSALGEALEFIARHPRRDPAQRFSANIADPRTSALLMEAAKGLRTGNLASAGRALLAAGGLLQALGGADMNAQTWNALFTTDPDRWAQRAGMLGLFDTQEDSVRACASLANHLAHCIRMEFEPPAFPPMHFESELQSSFFAVGSQIEAIQIQEAAGQASTLATAKARSI